MRGFLWEDLSHEVAEEFAALVEQPLLAREQKKGEILYRLWLERELERLPADIRSRLGRVEGLAKGREKLAEKRQEGKLALKKYKPRVAPAETYHAQYKRRQRALEREKMPDERRGVTQKFTLTSLREGSDETYEVKGYITASLYPDDHERAGQVGEVFVKVGKPGAETKLLDAWAKSFSRELQRGEDLEKLCRKDRHTQFLPAGAVTGIAGITRCSSPTDLVCNWLMRRFLGKEI